MNFRVDQLDVHVEADRAALGAAAAAAIAEVMKSTIAAKGSLRMAFASAPSQEEFLAGLIAARGIVWSRVTVFQLDEYVGLPKNDPRRFGQFLRARVFDRAKPGNVHLIGAGDPEEECRRYAKLIAEAPLDIVCLGIGENGHLAFNDPPVADFNDPEIVKIVALDEMSRQQQVNDGLFLTVEEVPTHAITLTIPTLLSGKQLVCVVPGPTKREAVKRTLTGPISTDCPASILRTHPNCALYLDTESYGG